MTIPSTARKAGPLLGTGAQTAWPFTFKVFATSDIAVTIANALGTETALVLDTDYSVALNVNQETSPGGTVTYPISGAALPVGSVLSIVGDLDYDQPLDLPSGGNFSPTALENELDRLTMQIQQLKENLGRALQVTVTTGASVALPVPEANQLIGWDAGGLNLQNIDIADLATAVTYGTFRYDTFVGDGVTTQFTPSANPATIANLDVAVDGLTWVPGTDYSLTSGVVVFATAPTNGAEILVRYGEAMTSAPGDAADISYHPAGTGALATTVQGKLRESVSVKDFGAVGDGVTDDTVAINAALAAANKVFVPAGTYKISSGLVLTTQRLYGENRDTSIVKPTAAVAVAITVNSTGVGMTSLQDLFIDGSATTGKTGVLFGTTLSSDFDIHRLRVSGFTGASAVGMQFNQTVAVSLYDCYITANTQNVYIYGNGTTGALPTTLWFNDCHITQAVNEGVFQVAGEHVDFTNCIFESNGKEGLKISPVTGGSNYARHGSLKNCWFENNWAGHASRTANTANNNNYTYCVTVDGTLVGGRVGLHMDNCLFNTTAVLSDHKSIHLTYVTYCGLSKVTCSFGFAHSIVINHAASFVQFLDNAGVYAVGYVYNINGATVQYPLYGNLLGNGATNPQIPAAGLNMSANAAAPGMTSQALAWYEEGTWTPTQGSQTVVGAFTSGGFYTRIGRVVHVTGWIKGATSVAGTTNSYVGGLPFASNTASGFSLHMGSASNASASISIAIYTYLSNIYICEGYAATGNLNFSATYIA